MGITQSAIVNQNVKNPALDGHNRQAALFCIDDERLEESRGTVEHFTPANVAFDQHMVSLRDTAADEEFREMEFAYENQWSTNVVNH
jgi:hypothetical protein